jgi:uncharacterized protein YegP (UPF0339 family)
MAIAPWLMPVVKAFELPGGWKIEFQELRATRDKAEQAGLLVPPPESEGRHDFDYPFQVIADQDPNLALAGLRIEIEKRLNRIAKVKGISARKPGIIILMKELLRAKVLTEDEYSALSDLTLTLNSAVHGAKIDENAKTWAMDIGPQILEALNRKSGPSYMVFQGDNELYYLRIRSDDGRVLASSEAYASLAGVENAIASLKK